MPGSQEAGAVLVEVDHMRSIWKLLPIAAVLAIGIGLASWTRPASADVAAVTPSTTAPAIGVPITVNASVSNVTIGQQVTVLATGSGAGTFAVGATLTPDAFLGGGTNFLSV